MIWPSVVGIKAPKWPGCHLFRCTLKKSYLSVFLGCNLEIFKYFPCEEKLHMLICMPCKYWGGGG